LAHSLSKLGNANKNRKSDKDPYPSMILFIGPSKRLTN
jgi:hypothetical protein